MYVLRNISNRALSDLYLVYLLDICLISFSIYSLPGTSLAPGLIVEYDLTLLLYCSLRFCSPYSADLLGFRSPYCILCIPCTLSIGCACRVIIIACKTTTENMIIAVLEIKIKISYEIIFKERLNIVRNKIVVI